MSPNKVDPWIWLVQILVIMQPALIPNQTSLLSASSQNQLVIKAQSTKAEGQKHIKTETRLAWREEYCCCREKLETSLMRSANSSRATETLTIWICCRKQHIWSPRLPKDNHRWLHYSWLQRDIWGLMAGWRAWDPEDDIGCSRQLLPRL